jgi:hypothetical protein
VTNNQNWPHVACMGAVFSFLAGCAGAQSTLSASGAVPQAQPVVTAGVSPASGKYFLSVDPRSMVFYGKDGPALYIEYPANFDFYAWHCYGDCENNFTKRWQSTRSINGVNYEFLIYEVFCPNFPSGAGSSNYAYIVTHGRDTLKANFSVNVKLIHRKNA